MPNLSKITNTPRDYAWGAIDGVSRALGTPPSGKPEAELWLGAHALNPAVRSEKGSWGNLAEWEHLTGKRLPFLLKVLSAAHPLSLQAHPNPAQAAAGFAREEAAGIALTARERSYKDPNAKPELIVAVDDGFEALCGFRPVPETLALIDALSAVAADAEPFRIWREKLEAGVAQAFAWLLSDDQAVQFALAAAVAVAQTDQRCELIKRLADEYAGDPGVLIAAMLNHVTLASGEALWLPAGNIHAYLRGTGIELMGPSDNVLRGGLTPKHIDRKELTAVLDFTPGLASRLAPIELAPDVVTYRPASTDSGRNVDFELAYIAGDARITVPGPSIALAVSRGFTINPETEPGEAITVQHGEAVFIEDAGTLEISGNGRLFLASGLGFTA